MAQFVDASDSVCSKGVKRVERSDSITTLCNEGEWETSRVPLNHTTNTSASVLLMGVIL